MGFEYSSCSICCKLFLKIYDIITNIENKLRTLVLYWNYRKYYHQRSGSCRIDLFSLPMGRTNKWFIFLYSTQVTSECTFLFYITHNKKNNFDVITKIRNCLNLGHRCDDVLLYREQVFGLLLNFVYMLCEWVRVFFTFLSASKIYFCNGTLAYHNELFWTKWNIILAK